ncbi:MAG: DUF2971 domain-containing protein [Planctomycetota bacterium]|jgi:hypothetical protein
MNVLYKYCDQKGIEIILRTLELKLPYISQVNDPLECLPVFYCPDDKQAMKEQCLRTFNRNHISPPVNWEQEIDEQFEKGEIQKKLIEGLRKELSDFNRKSCLLSVSKTAQNTVMWAHYAKQHEGAVIGIDFNNVYPDTNGLSNLVVHSVTYSEDRPKINVLSNDKQKEFQKVPSTKSIDWGYEKEFRAAFSVDSLEGLRQRGLAHLKDFKNKKTWFLRLNPVSIREVIFGLYTDKSLKSDIRKLIERQDLQHVKLYQAEESETYTLNLK